MIKGSSDCKLNNFTMVLVTQNMETEVEFNFQLCKTVLCRLSTNIVLITSGT